MAQQCCDNAVFQINIIRQKMTIVKNLLNVQEVKNENHGGGQ